MLLSGKSPSRPVLVCLLLPCALLAIGGLAKLVPLQMEVVKAEPET